MRNRITFGDLRSILDQLIKGNDDYLLDYINEFKGDTVYEKLINILKCWHIDVSPTLSFKKNKKTDLKIPIEYIVQQINSPELGDSFEVVKDDLTIFLGIPKEFTKAEFVPIYKILRGFYKDNKFINLESLDEEDRLIVIDRLPPKLCNTIYNAVEKDRSKVISVDNPTLSHFKLNLLTREPFIFVKSMFEGYTEDSFRDIIFNLSKRIDSKVLMDSTLQDIEYYIEKYSAEVEKDNNNLQL